MADIAWTSDLELGITEIDKQHRNFVGIINALHSGVEERDAALWLEPLLDQLQGYTTYHFGTEEMYFRLFNYENSLEHIAEHRKLSRGVTNFVSRFKSGGEDVSRELSDFLMDWLENHLKTHDRKYVACFKGHGLK